MTCPIATGIPAPFVDADSAQDANSAQSAVNAEFAALYEAQFGRIYAFVRSQVASIADAHDLVGRVFLKAYASWSRAPEGEAAVVWLFRIARNTVIDYWRVEKRRVSVQVSVDELEHLSTSDLDPEEQYIDRQRQATLLHAIGLLDEDNRMLLSLKFTAQRTNREIARILGVSEAAVSMRLLRALRRLRDELVKLGVR